MKPYYTSNSLIYAVDRKISTPFTQYTFSPQDVLDFAYDELMSEQVPSIMQYHEEYFVYKKFYVDSQGQLCQMSRISPDDKNFFEVSSGPIIYPIHYFLENNQIVIVPAIQSAPTGKLQMSFFLRPNKLVPDEMAAICSSFSKTITVDNTTIVSGNKLNIGTLVIEAGVNFPIGINSSATALNLTTYINNLNNPDLEAVNNGAICNLIYSDRNLKVSADNKLGFKVQTDSITINCPSVPEGITGRSYVDILQMDGGHSTLNYDVFLGANTVSQTSITVPEKHLSKDFILGDYICARYQCIVPQIPTDLHSLLAERVCSRLLASMGDVDSANDTEQKINRLESRQSVMMDNRVDGSPQKVTNFNGLLRNRRTGFRGRR